MTRDEPAHAKALADAAMFGTGVVKATTDGTTHIELETIREPRKALPEMGAARACGKLGCPAPRFTTGLGFAGGGFGVYEFCEVCGQVVAKTQLGD
jgi:hypothetical protein